MTDSTMNPLDWSTVKPHFDALRTVELTQDNVHRWLQKWSDLTAHLQEADAQIYRDVTENTADEEAEQRFLTFVEDIMPEWQKVEQALKEKVLAFEEFTPSNTTEQMMKRFQTEAAIYRDENVPLRSELMKLANEYEKIVGGLTIEWEGQEETIPQAHLHLQDTEQETRERAWRKIMDAYLGEREGLNELYLKMLRLRRQVARNAGFDNFRQYQWKALGRFDYTPEDCFTFHDAIEHEVVPLATQLYQELMQRLGFETLRPWDVDADPHGERLVPFKESAELEEGGYRIFEQVDPVLAQHFAAMRDGYLDLASRPKKAPGGYCSGFPISGKPYIFMNAVGTHDDVGTLLHEGGHAFHFMESQVQPLIWNYNGPMEFCEVASMAMELLAAPYLQKGKGGFYEEADARRANAQHLREILLFLPYMAIVDAFQHWVYTEAPENVSSADLDAKWSELWERFVPGIDYSGLETEKETGWHRKGHIFTVPFYYIEYGLAQLGALQVWRNALADQAKAVADYRTALTLGNTRPLPALFEAAGATLAFDREMVGRLMDLIREQLARLEAGSGEGGA
ncbi:MAG: M3 family oligoendopeptidase [Chloroflexota bacterium]|nr:M3 family oligoendopeptidase [Chloroflexota bacterium]